MIIEGKRTYNKLENGLIESILLRYHIPIMFTYSREDTAYKLCSFYKKLNDEDILRKIIVWLKLLRRLRMLIVLDLNDSMYRWYRCCYSREDT